MAEIIDKQEGHGNMEKEKVKGKSGVNLNMPVGHLDLLIEKQDGMESATSSMGKNAAEKFKHVGHFDLEKEKDQEQLKEKCVGHEGHDG